MDEFVPDSRYCQDCSRSWLCAVHPLPGIFAPGALYLNTLRLGVRLECCLRHSFDRMGGGPPKFGSAMYMTVDGVVPNKHMPSICLESLVVPSTLRDAETFIEELNGRTIFYFEVGYYFKMDRCAIVAFDDCTFGNNYVLIPKLKLKATRCEKKEFA